MICLLPVRQHSTIKLLLGDGKLVLNSTAVTSTAAELNLLDGVSGLVQADLTKLAALDATATELNLLDDATHLAVPGKFVEQILHQSITLA